MAVMFPCDWSLPQIGETCLEARDSRVVTCPLMGEAISWFSCWYNVWQSWVLESDCSTKGSLSCCRLLVGGVFSDTVGCSFWGVLKFVVA